MAWRPGVARPQTKAGSVTAFTVGGLGATGAMQQFQTGTRRDIIGGDFKYILDNWTFTGAFRHEHKEGSMEQASMVLMAGRRSLSRSITTPTAMI